MFLACSSEERESGTNHLTLRIYQTAITGDSYDRHPIWEYRALRSATVGGCRAYLISNMDGCMSAYSPAKYLMNHRGVRYRYRIPLLFRSTYIDAPLDTERSSTEPEISYGRKWRSLPDRMLYRKAAEPSRFKGSISMRSRSSTPILTSITSSVWMVVKNSSPTKDNAGPYFVYPRVLPASHCQASTPIGDASNCRKPIPVLLLYYPLVLCWHSLIYKIDKGLPDGFIITESSSSAIWYSSFISRFPQNER